MMNGIKDLKGRAPVGAVLTVGRKPIPPERPGFPKCRDRFFFMHPAEQLVGHQQRGNRKIPLKARPKHASFRRWNVEEAQGSTYEQTSAHRREVTGWLVHRTADEAFNHHLKAYAHPRDGMAPSRLPFCIGDGERAERRSWRGEDETTEIIPCPHDRCVFRQPEGKQPAACKPYATLLFQVQWRGQWASVGLPTPLVKYTTQSWNTIRNLKGFFDDIHERAAALGIPAADVNLMTFPFSLTLAEHTNAKGNKFPVVTITPLQDAMSFFLESSRRRQQLAEMTGAAPVSLLEGPETNPGTLLVDHHQNRPGYHTDAAEVTDE